MRRNRKRSDDALLEAWYRFAAEQAGFIGELLALLRERQRTSIRAQRKAIGASKKNFTRLQGMPLPRPNQYVADARHIANVCELSHPDEFVRMLLLGRSIRRASEQAHTFRNTESFESALGSSIQAYYQAAMDVDISLNDLPEEEEE